MRCFFILFLLAASSASLPAQSSIDGVPEGTSFTSGVMHGFPPLSFVTFRDLDRGEGTAPDAFVVDDASSTLRFERGFGAPNVLNFGPAVAGPTATFGRCKLFAFDISGLVTSMKLYLWVSRAEAGNTVRFELVNGATPVGIVDAPIPPGSAPHAMRILLSATPLAAFDEVRVTCVGTQAGGTFHGAIDRFEFSSSGDSVPSPYCGEFFGGGNTPCPCGNSGPPADPEGCSSSRGFGARMRAAGDTSLGNDSFELLCQQVPSSAAILVRGMPFVQTGFVFGDGVSCLGGTLVRVTSRRPAGGTLHYPDPGEPPLSTIPGTTTGVTFGYQVVYRNPAAFCTSATFNVSDTQPAVWTP